MGTVPQPSWIFCLRMFQQFSIGLRSGWWGPHQEFFSFYAHSSQWCRGIPCSMTRCIVMHADDFVTESMIFIFVPRNKVVSQKLRILFVGHFHTFRGPKGADQLSPYDSGPKHDSATSLLALQPWWDMVTMHQPFTTASIWTIQGCTAVISEQDCLKMSLRVFLGPLQPFLLVNIV